MAQTITLPMYGHFIVPPGNNFTLADQTATSASVQPRYPSRWVNAVISLKVFTAGSGTVGVIFIIEGADDTAITVNVRRVAEQQATVRENFHCMMLQGGTPDGAKAFFRVRVVFNGTDTGTYDAQLFFT